MSNSTPPPAGVRPAFTPLPLGAVTARGWLAEQLRVGRDGMGGHFDELEPDQVAKPYVTRDYDPSKGGATGLVGWCGEISGEYWLGLTELAWTLDDEGLKDKALRWIDAFLKLQEPDGYLGSYRPGDDRHDDFCTWGTRLPYRVLLYRYGQTGDRRYLDAVHRGLLWFTREWAGDQKTDYVGDTIIEQMVQVYLLTGDKALLDWCEDYARWMDAHGGKNTFCRQTLELGVNHVGALATRSILPAILSLANGREDYLRASEDAIAEFGRDIGWAAHYGPPSDTEHVSHPATNGESEYCDFIYYMENLLWLSSITGKASYADHVERIVFNAAQGARRKDDRAIAYDTSANQFLATMTSARWAWHEYYEVYAPNVSAACCPANSVRLWPEYIRLSVLRGPGDDLYVQLYGPWHAEAEAAGGVRVALDSETGYPFGDDVRLRISVSGGGRWTGRLLLRRPQWAVRAGLRRNGAPAPATAAAEGILALEGPWADGDVVEITFARVPVVRAVEDRDFTNPRLRAVDYGPLVFVQPLKEKWTKTKQSDLSWPTPPEWPWYDVTCDGQPTFYAMPIETARSAASAIRPKRVEVGPGLPWVTSPLRLEVPMIRASAAYPGSVAGWTHNPHPAANPVAPDSGAEVETVEFVPYGATCLRVTCFPLAEETPKRPVVIPAAMCMSVQPGELVVHARPEDHDDDVPRIPIGMDKIPALLKSATTFETDPSLPAEGYELAVTPQGAHVKSSTDAGAFYAIQTLRQLAVRKRWDSVEITVPCVEIRDWPHYPWRGMMLDEARHFFGKKTVRKFLDLMAYHKFNVFHWHLVDDQGWRLDLPRHPELAAYGARRPSTPVLGNPERGDDLPYGPFRYSVDDVREILAYAAERHIRVVPEIELPGHVRALLAAHPEFSCRGAGLAPRTPRTTWGIEKDVLCAGNEEALRYMEGVLDEVCELFPGEVIHIGGDECHKDRWRECPKCQARIRELGLRDEEELQGWVASRMAAYLASKGRRAIGWDEIRLGGNLDARAMVMNYFGPPKNGEAAAEGRDVVCCPSACCYFDWPQFDRGGDTFQYFWWGGTAPIEAVYRFDPADGVAEADLAHVLGAQGNNWTEYTPDEHTLFWKAYPRACALAEALWTYPAKSRDVEGFKKRLRVHMRRLPALGVTPAPLK